jgi:hypothetical protein
MVTSRDADTVAGPRHYYRVRITPAQPDFHVVLMPADNYRPDACTVHQGGNNYFTAFVWRHDGWVGDVTLTAEGLPKGVTCPAQTIGAGVRAASIAVSADAKAADWSGTIKFKATATINGKKVEREVRYASIVWPGFPQIPMQLHNRLTRDLALAVREKAPFELTTGISKASVPQGGKVTVPLKLTRLWPDYKAQLQIFPNPQEIPFNVLTYGVTTIQANQTAGQIVLNINSSARPGTYNVVFRCFGPVPFNKDPKSKVRPLMNVVQCSTPVAVTILPKQVARVNLSSGAVNVKAGAEVEVTVRVARLFDYGGEFKVELVVPPTVKGVSAAEVTIPAGKTEGKLVIKAAADAQIGNRGALMVKTTALYNKVPLVQQSQINVNVIK